MITVSELIERVATQPPGAEVVAVTNEHGVATLMFRDAKTGLLSSPVELYLEHAEVRSQPDTFLLPVIGDGQGVVEGAPTRAKIFVSISTPVKRLDGRLTVTIPEGADASDARRFVIRGFADQVAKRAGEAIGDIPVAEVGVIDTEPRP